MTEIRWFESAKASKRDVPGYYCLGFNAHWSAPRIRVGSYDALDAEHRFRLIGGPHMELGPSHIANLPKDPFSLELADVELRR